MKFNNMCARLELREDEKGGAYPLIFPAKQLAPIHCTCMTVSVAPQNGWFRVGFPFNQPLKGAGVLKRRAPCDPPGTPTTPTFSGARTQAVAGPSARIPRFPVPILAVKDRRGNKEGE